MPVRNGGLEIRRVSSLASSAFLASAARTQLQDQLLAQRPGTNGDDDFDQCLAGRTNPDMLKGKARVGQNVSAGRVQSTARKLHRATS